MPLPTDEKLLALSNDLLQQFETIFGEHPGFRPAHAKGILLTGTFTPSPRAATLSRAPHLTRPSTPVTVRFSNSTGLPLIPDNDPNASPHGLAIRFHLAEHSHTDIVAHSTDGFPTTHPLSRPTSAAIPPRSPSCRQPSPTPPASPANPTSASLRCASSIRTA